jgi:glutaredoxin
MKIALMSFFLFLSLFILAACAGPGKYDTFAQCLTDEGAIMYGTDWCSHCQNQKASFEGSFKNINYVNCDTQRDRCLKAKVTGYPTWVIDGESYSGVQSLSRLADLTGCPLIEEAST